VRAKPRGTFGEHAVQGRGGPSESQVARVGRVETPLRSPSLMNTRYQHPSDCVQPEQCSVALIGEKAGRDNSPRQ
jgi:hypothetical protein